MYPDDFGESIAPEHSSLAARDASGTRKTGKTQLAGGHQGNLNDT